MESSSSTSSRIADPPIADPPKAGRVSPIATDEELVARALEGDARARDELIRRHRPMIRRHLFRYPFAEAERNDVLQDTLLQVVRKLHTFRGGARFSTWLYRVTANVALMRLREGRRERERMQEVEREPPPREPAPFADVQLEAAEVNARVDAALSRLSPRYRALLLAHYIEDAPLASIAERESTTETAVRSSLHRARAALRQLYEAAS